MLIDERAHAYTLLPDVDRQDTTLQGLCGATVERACAEVIAGQPMLLTDDGNLTCEKASVIIPEEICAIWPAEQAAMMLDEKGRPPLFRHVAAANQEKLRNWDVVEQIDQQMLLRTLQNEHLPKPQTWRQLLNLWAYIAPEITRHWPYVSADTLRIVPIQGKDVLYAANDVVRLGEKKLLQSDADWHFLATQLRVLNQNWPRFLAEQRRSTAEDATLHEAVDAADAVLKKTHLDETSDVTLVIKQVADTFFAQKQINVQACVQLTQIAAKLGASAGKSFRYVTRDNVCRLVTHKILFDEDGMLEELLPEQVRTSHLLHAAYTAQFSSCSREEWLRWVSLGRSGILTFIPFVQARKFVFGRPQVEREARNRDLKSNIWYPFVTHRFIVEDWDFEASYWEHWQALASNDNRVWAKIVEHILNQSSEQWKRANSARLLQVATTGTERAITQEALLPNWVLRLRDLPCLPDTRGFLCKPGDLLRRTTETESLMDVEPFVHGRLDTEATRPLLDLLGVRSTPAGPDRLIERLRALAKAEKPPVQEVEKWYRRLDQMLDTCSTTDFEKSKQLFWSEKLVLTQDGGWATAATVFLSADEEDVPGVDVIRSSVCDLTLWRKIGVAERATAEQALQWLKGLPSGRVLAQDDVRRIRALLGRYPHHIWKECYHWLNLAGEWAPVDGLRYAMTMQSLVSWRHLHQWVKQKTADLQRFPGEVTGRPPFADLLPLAFHLEEQLQQDIHVIGRLEPKAWMATIGTELQQIQLDSEKDTQFVRLVAQRLARTAWQAVQQIDVVPYIDGTPAGTARQADVLWSGQILYVSQISMAKLARHVPEEIGKMFSCDDAKVLNEIKAALIYGFERSPEQIQAYLEENFKLVPRISIPAVTSKEPDLHTSELPPTSLPEPDVGTSSIAEPDVTPSDIATSVNNAENETSISITGDVQDDEASLDQSDDAEEEPANDVSQTPVRPRPAPKPAQPSMMERFAKAHGFRKDGDSRFVHNDGSWMGRTNGMAFPWERRTATGDLLRYYWTKEHCLEHAPLPLEADIWGMLDHQPAMYALILLNSEGEPIEMTGTHLRALHDEEQLTLYPASYRLVYTHDDHASKETY